MNHIGGLDRTDLTWNFDGSQQKNELYHNAPAPYGGTSGSSVSVTTEYSYDHRGRKKIVSNSIDGAIPTRISELRYNDIGELIEQKMANGLESNRFEYNERNWLTSKINSKINLKFEYNTGAYPQYNGNIAKQHFQNGNPQNAFTYRYDSRNQLTEATANGMSESIRYDQMGNILSLDRDGTGPRTFNYFPGNSLKLLNIPGVTSSNYQYDRNGNVSYDARNQTTFTYNYLNLPNTAQGVLANTQFNYNAIGEKLRKTVTNLQSNITTTTDYVGTVQYVDNQIDFIRNEVGIARRSNQYIYEYSLTDHLGNSRVLFRENPNIPNATQVLQRDDYYAFGKRKSPATSSSNNNYLFNGKEIYPELNDLYDFGARLYDPEISRWNAIDPLAEKSRAWSPYTFTLNNPLKYIDPDGRDIKPVSGGVMYTGEHAVIAYTAFLATGAKKFHLVYESKTPHIYRHTLNSFAKGKPTELHYDSDRNRQNARRKIAIKGYLSRYSEGLERDEYPYASTFEGGEGANIAYVPGEQNSRQGGHLSVLYKTLAQGEAFLVLPVPNNEEPDKSPVPVPVPVAVPAKSIRPAPAAAPLLLRILNIFMIPIINPELLNPDKKFLTNPDGKA